jgi:4-hydroxymandelate oxidase
MNRPLDLFDYETLAPQHLSPMAWDYYASGAGDEVTLKENREAFDRLKLRPRMLVDVSQRTLQTQVLGQLLSAPILVAPMAFQCLAHPEGEMATAKAAAALGIGMVLSTMSTQSLERVAMAFASGETSQPQMPPQAPSQTPSQTPLWFQLYVHRDRHITEQLVSRAETAGYRALCVTVDAPLLGCRKRDRRHRFTLPAELELANLATLSDLKIPQTDGESGLFAYFAQQLDPGLTWNDLEELRSLTHLPIVVKGILRGDDAQRAADCGVNAIIVSNHGGRQLDGAIASIDALPDIVAAVSSPLEILVDGGIRRGTDILKALALGANAVLVGRPILWGLAVNGEAGVGHVLELLRDELDLAMALSGCANIAAIDPSLIH